MPQDLHPSHPVVIGVDPGTTAGSLAVLAGSEITVNKLPSEPALFFGLILSITGRYPDACWFIEDVGRPRPGNRLDSVYTFAKHRGHVEMALIATDAAPQSRFVSPDKWMTGLVPSKDWPHGNESKQVTARKGFFHKLAKEKTGGKFPKYAGDSVCIALYGSTQI
jgi:hypothetical protein